MTRTAELKRILRKSTLMFALMFCCLFGLPNAAQIQSGRDQRPTAQQEWEAQQKRAAEKSLNEKRQKDLKTDTDKLLQLATELKEYVDKTDEHTLSFSVIKKAEEIEKLAHTVKEKMKGP